MKMIIIRAKIFVVTDTSWWCYASFSESRVPPNTEVQLRLSFSLRAQERTVHWTYHRFL